MKLIVLAAGAAILMSAGAEARAPIDEIRLGVLAHDSGPFTRRKEHGAGINGEIIFKAPRVLKFLGSPRPILGASIATEDGATNAVYAGLAWQVKLPSRFFVEGGAGIAVHDGDTQFKPTDKNINGTIYLGCRALFRLSADLGYRLTDRLSVSAHADHMSNAGLCDDNEGLDNTGVRLGYRF
ncbi:MAG TPA: acyloxyacyl hydrolase [Parvularculaceae bacterium]|nr:acyloxyacyl hydrolase [Parvularculaceae bacterium]